VSTKDPRTIYEPYPAPGRRGVFEGDRVRIETTSGELVEERGGARSHFRGRPGLRRKLWWDHLDLLYFAGYALWNYMAAPFAFTGPGFEVSEGEPWDEAGERWRRLDVDFPPGFPTHSAQQSFYYDAEGLLRRQDYTAEAFGGWAKAVHLCDAHREFDGLVVPTRRRVHPKLPSGKPFRPLTLVWLDVERVELR
jgi:hypothetical protein